MVTQGPARGPLKRAGHMGPAPRMRRIGSHPGVLVNHQQRKRVRGRRGSRGCGTRSRCCAQSPRVSCRPGPRQDASAAPRRGCPPVSAASRESAARRQGWALPVAALAAGLTLCSAGAGSGPRLRARAPSARAQCECADGCPSRGRLCPLSATCCSQGLELPHQSPRGAPVVSCRTTLKAGFYMML